MAISSIFGDPSLTHQKTAAESNPYVLSGEDKSGLMMYMKKYL